MNELELEDLEEQYNRELETEWLEEAGEEYVKDTDEIFRKESEEKTVEDFKEQELQESVNENEMRTQYAKDAEGPELARVTREKALLLLEQSVRTKSDFEKLVKMYDKLDANRERKQRYWEKLSTEKFVEWSLWRNETVIPRPLEHEWWRELLRGNPIDVIFDCPHEIHNLASSASIFEPLQILDAKRRQLLYYRIIRGWSPQMLAKYHGQTDRNIRKVYDTAIAKIRKGLYERLSPRFEEDKPLTFAQREFCRKYKAALESGKNGGNGNETE